MKLGLDGKLALVTGSTAGIGLTTATEPREIANVIAYAASEAASATNGAALRVDGGVIRAILRPPGGQRSRRSRAQTDPARHVVGGFLERADACIRSRRSTSSSMASAHAFARNARLRIDHLLLAPERWGDDALFRPEVRAVG